MADDRIYLRCRKCKIFFPLCKYYTDTGWHSGVTDPIVYLKEFDEFLQQHDKCHKQNIILLKSPFECVLESELYFYG